MPMQAMRRRDDSDYDDHFEEEDDISQNQDVETQSTDEIEYHSSCEVFSSSSYEPEDSEEIQREDVLLVYNDSLFEFLGGGAVRLNETEIPFRMHEMSRRAEIFWRCVLEYVCVCVCVCVCPCGYACIYAYI
jgi:hypothetical protein